MNSLQVECAQCSGRFAAKREKSMATLRTGLRSKNPAVRQASKVAMRSTRLRHPAEKKEPASK